MSPERKLLGHDIVQSVGEEYNMPERSVVGKVGGVEEPSAKKEDTHTNGKGT
jgi:hypothetical protein